MFVNSDSYIYIAWTKSAYTIARVRRRVIKCIRDVSRTVVLVTRMVKDSMETIVSTSSGAAAITITTIRIDSVIRITVLAVTQSEARGDNVAEEGVK